MKPSALFIITGASRGLGGALARQVLSAGVRLLCLSRSTDAALAARADAAGAVVEQWSVDLSQPVEVAARVEAAHAG